MTEKNLEADDALRRKGHKGHKLNSEDAYPLDLIKTYMYILSLQAIEVIDTDWPFCYRYKERERSLDSNNLVRALPKHANRSRSNIQMKIYDFDLTVLRNCTNSVETCLAEINAINTLRLHFNRKFQI